MGRAGFGHADYGQGVAVGEGDFDAVEDLVAAGEVERDAGEGRAHFKTGKTGGVGGGFAGFENSRADAAAGEIGMDEEGADFGGVGRGVEEFGLADWRAVGAEKGFAFAPAAAASEDAGTSSAGFGDEISAVGDELSVEAQDGAEGAFDLFGSVVVALEGTDRSFDEFVERRNVGCGGEAEGDVQFRGHVIGAERDKDNARALNARRYREKTGAEHIVPRRAEAGATKTCLVRSCSHGQRSRRRHAAKGRIKGV